MMSANVLSFIENPSLDICEKCHKDALLSIADHFHIAVSQQLLERKFKIVVLDKLLELQVLALPAGTSKAD